MMCGRSRADAAGLDAAKTSLGDQDAPRASLSVATVDAAIRLGFIALLGYWSYRVIAPFLMVGLWSAILVVALYPLFERLARRLGPRLAAMLVTVLCLMLVVGPVTWLGLGMIAGLGALQTQLDAGSLVVPLPPQSVRSWPVIGESLHQLWTLAATNMKDAFAEVAPMLKPIGGKLLDIGERTLFGLLELLASIVIAGFFFTSGPELVDALGAFLGRVLSHRGKDLVELAGATIRNVSRGVVGIALLQAFLAGAGFLAAGLTAAGVLAFVAFLLAVVQIGAGILILPIVVSSWMWMDTPQALIFTAYMIPVGLLDNILKPFLMSRGLTTPMPVIMVGVIGGTLAYGLIGLFFGPIVLSVAWVIMRAWVQGDDAVAAD
jgi:predicted PurR-regulated permease PerM